MAFYWSVIMAHSLIHFADEFFFHRKRDLPLFERIGHPVDTASFIFCLLIALNQNWFGPSSATVYLGAGFISCLLITKDEFIHRLKCSSKEMWLHACLFVLHPVVLFAVWQLAREPKARDVLQLYNFLAFGVMAFQIGYWNRNLWPSQSTLRHLRFGFSLFLMPIFFFSLGFSKQLNWLKAFELFLTLGLGVFAASNGYNSYYDRDETSIGGLENPPKVTPDLLYWSLAVEYLAIAFSWLLFGSVVATLLFIYGLFSKLYSHPRVRLKKYPLISFFGVAVFQGGLIFLVCILCFSPGVDPSNLFRYPSFWLGFIASSLIIAASYPITQIYQHREDLARGDQTLSSRLGVKGTLALADILFLAAGVAILLHWGFSWSSLIFIFSALPGLLYLKAWKKAVNEDESKANFHGTDRFLKISSVGSNLGFLLIWLINR